MSITDYPRASVSFPRDRRLDERDCSGGTFGIIIAYQESIIAIVLKIYGKANLRKMLINVDHDNLRTALLQKPNTFHSYPF